MASANDSGVDVQVSPVTQADHLVLRHLFDLYAYDFSEFLDLDVGDDGRFTYQDLAPYWIDSWRHPFFIRAAGKLAGFVLIHDRSRLTGAGDVHDVAEFFVLRKYRRQGVGRRAAMHVFQRFPGAWEIRQHPANVAATAFWRRVVDLYTGGQFREVVWDTQSWQGPVQMFTR